MAALPRAPGPASANHGPAREDRWATKPILSDQEPQQNSNTQSKLQASLLGPNHATVNE